MVSLWGKKDDDEETPPHNGESSDRTAEPRASEANERTRLLPQPHDGYLSPDDPAVSFISTRSCSDFNLYKSMPAIPAMPDQSILITIRSRHTTYGPFEL